MMGKRTKKYAHTVCRIRKLPLHQDAKKRIAVGKILSMPPEKIKFECIEKENEPPNPELETCQSRTTWGIKRAK
ncbi:hypothetical protein VTN00DRAFT_1059 [Thermoascus crustaceus]|uniref:uncharacterized protein n=1 Tax=Thermoascus crustaceus TaxID=5088 RepID=UPI0037433E30